MANELANKLTHKSTTNRVMNFEFDDLTNNNASVGNTNAVDNTYDRIFNDLNFDSQPEISLKLV